MGGMYGYLRYEIDRLAKGASTSPATHAIQAGIWPYDPHRAQTHTAAYGIKWSVQAPLVQEPVVNKAKLEVGLIGLVDKPSGLALDGRGELSAVRRTTDRWGYRVSGWQWTLSGVWSATGAAPSLGLWADGAYTSASSRPWPLDVGLRFGYRPAWPIPIPATSELGVLGTVGTHFKLPARLSVGDGIFDLKRVTVEPRLRVWSDASPGFGADLTVSFDTLVDRERRISLGGTVGYARHLWYRLNFRVQP